MATATDFATYLDAITTAIDNGDVATARSNYRKALTVLPQLAGVSADGVSINYSSASASLDMLRKEINSLSSGSVIMQPVEFGPRGGSTNYVS